MTDPTADVDRIPLTRSVHYAVRGMPEVPNQYGDGVLAPSEITLTYRAASDSQLGRVHAYVAGRIWVDGKELPLLPGGLYGQHYFDGLDGWPEWLAEEARLHDPAAATPAVPAPATDEVTPSRRAGLRDEIAAALEAADYRMDMRRGDLADAVLPVLYREWPWLRAEAEDAAVLPAPTDQTAEVCICGHTEQQHFEDVCITEITGCDCGDYLPPDAAHEVIDRWRQAALTAQAELRRLAGEAQQDEHIASTAEKAAALGMTPTEYRGESHRLGEQKIREAAQWLRADVAVRVLDALDGAQQPARETQQDPTQDGASTLDALPDRLEAVLTERFTELGNPFSEMRRHEKGPDGWPASRPVGPHQVAEVLRELIDAPAAVARSGQPDTDPEAES